MRVLAAVGSENDSFGVHHLLGRMKFKKVNGSLVHVVERLGTPLLTEASMASNDLITQFLKQQEDAGRNQIRHASEILEKHGIALSPTLRVGFISNELMAAAESEKSDLIAVTSRDETPIAKMLIGSVTRKLVVKAKQSLLVARGKQSKDGPITAIIATDHSDYCGKCLDILINDWPSGITNVIVLTSYPEQTIKIIGSIMQNVKVDIEKTVERVLVERNAQLQAKIEALGVRVQTKVSRQPIGEAINEVLDKSGAELLILGAQGHGFLDRIGVGSVSFQQVVEGKSSVLVLRAAI